MLAVSLSVLTVLFTMAAAALVVGRRSVAVAAQIRRVVTVPGATHVFRPGPVTPPFRFGPTIVVQSVQGFGVLAALLLVVGIVGIGLVVLYWSWFRRRPPMTTPLTDQLKWPGRPSR